MYVIPSALELTTFLRYWTCITKHDVKVALSQCFVLIAPSFHRRTAGLPFDEVIRGGIEVM